MIPRISEDALDLGEVDLGLLLTLLDFRKILLRGRRVSVTVLRRCGGLGGVRLVLDGVLGWSLGVDGLFGGLLINILLCFL